MIYYDKRGWAKFYGLTHPLSYLGILNFNYMRMGKFFIAAVLCLLSALGLVSCAPTQSDDCDYLPQSPSASEDIYSINEEDLTEGMRLSVLSAQGLLNRDGAEVYTYVGQDAWLLDFYKERGYVKEVRDYDDPYRLLSDICGDGISGIVVYDPEKKFTINLATNIAGVEDRIIVHPDDLQKVSEATGLTDVIDLRDMGFSLSHKVRSHIRRLCVNTAAHAVKHRHHGTATQSHGRDVRLVCRGKDLRRRLLQVDAVDVPQTV